MQIREMRAALSADYQHIGGLPESAPDWVVTGLYELRTKRQTRAATARNTQRPAQRVGAITAPKATDEAERMKLRLQAIQ